MAASSGLARYTERGRAVFFNHGHPDENAKDCNSSLRDSRK